MQRRTINGFALKRPLGAGGMAEVWYAENAAGKPAAVKVLNENLTHNQQIVERFHNEALVMVKLRHPNIRQVYGYGMLGGRHCIVMEYLDGSDLEDLMEKGRRFTDDELRRWWNQIADTLNYTHSMGVVHRDIKPSNLFLDKYGNIKLLDFGIAKLKESMSMTRTGAMMGTLIYMSPEQVLDSKNIDYRSDIYSLAVTFVHLLSGKAPYDSTTSGDYAVRKGIVEKYLDLSAFPIEWQNLLHPYLEKNPQKRPALRPIGASFSNTKATGGNNTISGKGPADASQPLYVQTKQNYPRAQQEQTKHGVGVPLSIFFGLIASLFSFIKLAILFEFLYDIFVLY